MSPTARSLKYLREMGYLADVVERWIPMARIRKDLFGIGDIFAIKDNERLIVQTTSASNVSARVRKIADHENTPKVRSAGVSIHVHGWRKNAAGRWVITVKDLS